MGIVILMAKTALEITDKDMAIYRATAIQRAEQARQKHLQRAQQAQELARQAAELLKVEFGATEVILFGSLARGYIHQRSDIDLAVKNILPQNFWRAWIILDRLDDTFEIDLFDIDAAPPTLRLIIEREGIVL